MFIGAMGLLAACGSAAADDEPDGSGGAGGEGGAGTRGEGGAGAGGTDDAGGDPTGEQACLDFCHQLEVNDCGFPHDDCAEFCSEQFERVGEPCGDALGALFACALPFAPSCQDGAPDACDEETEAVDACRKLHGCGVEQCSAGGGAEGETCGCESTCQGKQYETQCDTPAGGATTCACLVDGVEVGTCEGESANACGVKESCCQAEYFNIP
ncbi:hypothetical protein [Sorangium sp. So ce1024]|uniref:hypothetical protein n=2 Tax=unclassified Sorangium TaxID=2621164 RepID=UPI003F0DF4AF